MWITDVLPRPVGKLQEGGKSAAIKRSKSAVCQGNGALPVRALKASANSVSYMVAYPTADYCRSQGKTEEPHRCRSFVSEDWGNRRENLGPCGVQSTENLTCIPRSRR